MKPRNRISSQRKTTTKSVHSLRKNIDSVSRDILNESDLHVNPNPFAGVYPNDESNSDQRIETTFPRVFRHSFPVTSIRSAEYISETKLVREQMHRFKDDQGVSETKSCPVDYLPTSYLNRLLGIPSQHINDNLAVHKPESVELFYDSDPETYRDVFPSTSVPKVTVKGYGTGDEDKTNTIHVDTKMVSMVAAHRETSILDNLNVNEFDTTNSKLVTELISVSDAINCLCC